MVRIVSLSVLLTLIIILGLAFFQVLAPFLLPLFLAGVFAILCQPLYRYFLDRTKQRVRIASALTTGTIVAIILIPIAAVTILSSLQLYVVATRLSDQNWTRTYREKTEPLLQSIADFMNDRMSEPHAEGPVQDGPVQDDDASDTRDGKADQASEPADGTAKKPASLPADATPEAIASDVQPPETRPPPALESKDGTASAGTDARIGTSAEMMAEPSRIEEFTPANIRAQLGDRVRSSLLEIGRKSLGTAGRTITGTFDVLSGAVVAVVSAVIGFLVFVIALYYFLADGAALLTATEKLIPVHVEYQRQILDQFAKVVRSVVMATFFAGLVQGFATVIALWVFGFDHLFVLLILAILSSLIPMMGTWLVWGPCALWLMWNGHWIQASLLSTYGIAVVGMLDNAVRTYILNTDAKLHPLLALISVLGGLQAMGLWGMFIGPIIASCLHALVKIFNHELAVLSKEKFAVIEEPSHDKPPSLENPSSSATGVSSEPAQNADVPSVSTKSEPEPPSTQQPREPPRTS